MSSGASTEGKTLGQFKLSTNSYPSRPPLTPVEELEALFYFIQNLHMLCYLCSPDDVGIIYIR